MKVLTPAQARTLVASLCSHFGMFRRRKSSAAEMTVIADVFGYAALFGVRGYPSRDEFLSRFVTTIGPVIYDTEQSEALADTDPAAYVALYAHECTHGVQWYREPFTFPGRYLGLVLNAQGGEKEPRALYEAEAEGAALEVLYLLTGNIPTERAALARRFSAGYGFGDAELLYQDALLTGIVTSVKSGLVSSRAAQFVRANL